MQLTWKDSSNVERTEKKKERQAPLPRDVVNILDDASTLIRLAAVNATVGIPYFYDSRRRDPRAKLTRTRCQSLLGVSCTNHRAKRLHAEDQPVSRFIIDHSYSWQEKM